MASRLDIAANMATAWVGGLFGSVELVGIPR